MILIENINNINLNIALIIQKLHQGEIFIFPTDTIYGLCCLANNIRSVQKIYQIKERDLQKSLTVFAQSIEKIADYVKLNALSKKLIEEFFPGALTLILPKTDDQFDHISNNQFLGIRYPKDDFLQNILKQLHSPLIATSVNISSESEISTVSELIYFAQQNQINLIFDPNYQKKKSSTILKIAKHETRFLRFYPQEPLYQQIKKIINSY